MRENYKKGLKMLIIKFYREKLTHGLNALFSIQIYPLCVDQNLSFKSDSAPSKPKGKIICKIKVKKKIKSKVKWHYNRVYTKYQTIPLISKP
jgi:hypothetical protein